MSLLGFNNIHQDTVGLKKNICIDQTQQDMDSSYKHLGRDLANGANSKRSVF